jgi:hypothetical protein
MKVYIGFDQREEQAYEVAQKSLRRFWPGAPVEALKSDRLAACGLLRRLQDRRTGIYDLASNAPCATDFAISRFLVPILSQSGPALFVDSDVVFFADPRDLLEYFDPDKAVIVVKHPHLAEVGRKMDGQLQLAYRRKNWSSVMLFNCDHPANRRLSLQDVNERPGRDLHAFYWLHDDEIGELPAEWNWLVNVQPKPAEPKIAHFTLGGPFLPGWDTGAHEHDALWLEASRG